MLCVNPNVYSTDRKGRYQPMSNHVEFCKEFCAKLKEQADITGEVNEDALKPLVSKLLKNFASLYNIKGLEPITEQYLSELKVRPDISIYVRGLICGHVELKNPRVSVDVQTFKDHDKKQAERLLNLPNLLYTNGREWILYRSGKIEGNAVKFSGEPKLEGGNAVDGESAHKLEVCLCDFLQWQPQTPHEPSKLAEHLAFLAQTLRGEAEEALKQGSSKILQLKEDLEKFFIPDIEGVNIGDAIAQTVTYSLLLARLEGAEKLTPREATEILREKNKVLALLLELFAKAEDDLKTGFALLRRSLESLNVQKFSKTSEMDVYFYENFLRAYDPKLSKDAGIYYTPREVVALQARLSEGILEEYFNKTEGFASKDVTLLDPAVGTGAYLMEALHRGMKNIEKRFGKAQVAVSARQMMENMYGIELLVGPYIVAHVQLSKAFKEYQDTSAKDGDIRANIYLGDTLSSPRESPHSLIASFYEALNEERERVRKIKTKGEVLVCLGNPPYDRQTIEQGDRNKYRKGGWVRYGDDIQGEERSDEQGDLPILEAFLKPAREKAKGAYLASIYNDYVYFWRWALWRLFEQQENGGIISFITASSYLRGIGFVGMREVMRRTFDELWILDLEGDSIGARKSVNIFNIRTPVAIAVGYRGKKSQPTTPARVRYVRIPGETRKEKLWALTQIEQLDEDRVFSKKGQEKFNKKLSPLKLEWQDCSQDWQAPFLPIATGKFFDWPMLNDLFPWHHPGAKFHRTWPIGETEEVLRKRWERLVSAPVEEKAILFKETATRKITYTTKVEMPGSEEPSIKELGSDSTPPPPPPVQPYSFRSFDNQYALIDARLGDSLRPPLWHSLSDKQIFFTTLVSFSFDKGPAITLAPHLPDIHYFCGRGGKDIFPLYRDKDAKKPNITHGLLDFLTKQYKADTTAEDLVAYIYALLGGQSYTQIFRSELETPGAHIPVTKDAGLFKQASNLGKKLIWLHTYAQRFRNKKQKRHTKIPKGNAKILSAITKYPAKFEYRNTSKELHIGNGRIGSVDSKVWNYEISGLKVLQSWLGYRMQNRKGKKSSKLDEIRPQQWSPDTTAKLINLIWILEATLSMELDLDNILQTVIKSECFTIKELPKPSDMQKKPPKPTTEATLIK